MSKGKIERTHQIELDMGINKKNKNDSDSTPGMKRKQWITNESLQPRTAQGPNKDHKQGSLLVLGGPRQTLLMIVAPPCHPFFRRQDVVRQAQRPAKSAK